MVSNAFASSRSIADKLLPLQQLIDSAVFNSAVVDYYNGKSVQAHEKVKIEKRTWSNYIAAEAAYRVGMFDNISMNQSTGYDASTLTNEGRQEGYYVGARVSVPLSAVYNRKSKIKVAQVEYERALAEIQTKEQQIRHKVMELYADVLTISTVLEIKVENLETSELQMHKAETDFLQNKIGINDMAAYSEILTKAKVDVTKTEAQLQLTLDILADICGCVVFNL